MATRAHPNTLTRPARDRLRRRGSWLIGAGCLLLLVGSPVALLGTTAVLTGGGFDADLEAGTGLVTLLTLLVASAAAGVAVLAGGMVCSAVARNPERAFPGWFTRAPRLEWLWVYAVRLMLAGFLAMVAGVTALLAGNAVELLASGEILMQAAEPALGDIGAGAIMAITMAGFVVGFGAVVLAGVAMAALWLGYTVRLWCDPSVPREEKTVARLFGAGFLIVGGMVLVVVFGTAGVPADHRLLRGTVTTLGALLLVGPATWAVGWAWRAGFRPWGTAGGGASRATIVYFVAVRGLAGILMAGWLGHALVNAWAV